MREPTDDLRGGESDVEGVTRSLARVAQSLTAGQLQTTAERFLIPAGAIVLSLILFGLFTALFGANPVGVYRTIYLGAFGSWFSWQNTLQRAAPLMLTALCTALPARLGLIVIGGEGALIVGAVATVLAAAALPSAGPELVLPAMMLAAIVAGGTWVALSGVLRYYRGVNETISSLLLNYIAIALMNQLVTGLIRDPAVVDRPSSWSIGRQNMVGNLPGMDVHWGLAFGIVACVLCYILMQHSVFGFSCRNRGRKYACSQDGRSRGGQAHYDSMLHRWWCGGTCGDGRSRCGRRQS